MGADRRFLAAQTEGDPRRRVLVINPESGADHIHPIELRDAKFRNAPNTDGEMQQLVQSIVKHVATIDGPLADIHPLTAPNWYGITRRLNPLRRTLEGNVGGALAAACGRCGADHWRNRGQGGIGQVQGLGGVGKSLLAEEYALHFGAAYPGGSSGCAPMATMTPRPLWGRSNGGATRRPSAPDRRAAGHRHPGLTAEQIEGALARKIASEGKPCLWVVDDVPNGLDGEALRRWFAPHPLARTLFTTRSREYGSLAKGIDLSVLTPDEDINC